MANNSDANKNAGLMWNPFIRRNDPAGTTTIYCRQCGRPIARTVGPQFRSVSKCALCLAIEAGVPNPEQHVLPQYYISDPTQPPIPLGEGDPLLALYPEAEYLEQKEVPSGGVMGTVRAIFRALVPWGAELDKPVAAEASLPKQISREKRSKGAYER